MMMDAILNVREKHSIYVLVVLQQQQTNVS
jgi:hypothetical protein